MFPLDGVSLQVLPEGAVVGVRLAAQFAHGVTDVHVVLCSHVRQCEKEKKKTSQKVSHGFKLRVSNTTLLSVSLFSKLISGCANCQKI